MEPLLSILPEEESTEEEVDAQTVSLKSTVKKAALAKSSTSYKDRVRGAFQNLKSLVEMGDEYENNANDE